MKIEATCTVTVSIEDISVNSIELAALQGAKEAALVKNFVSPGRISY